jgi:hypothetical protein
LGRGDDVIVRAFGDEPVALFVVSDDGEYITVASRDGVATVRFPRACVFRFDSALLSAMKAAFDRKEADLLKSLWRNLVRA